MNPKYSIISLFPDFLESFFKWGVIGQAAKKNLFGYEFVNPRSYTKDVHQSVDDRPFGGGDGMVMMAEPLGQAISELKLKSPRAPVIYLSAQGQVFNQKMANDWSKNTEMIFICGRYGGIDQRLIQTHVDQEVSVGDYVVSGGEIPLMIVLDAVIRHLPGVLGSPDSVQQDSFSQNRLEAPLYTRPREIWGLPVPEALTSGDHQRIQKWRELLGLLVTFEKRRDLFEKFPLTPSERELLKKELKKLSSSEIQTCGIEPGVYQEFLEVHR